MNNRPFQRRLRGAATPLRIAAAVFVLLVVVGALLAPWIAPAPPLAQNIPDRLQSFVSNGHLLGTDEFGRDVVSRLIYGARVELAIAIGSTVVALAIGASLGLIGAYIGGWAEMVSMRAVEALLAFPPIVLAMLVVTIYGSGQLTLIAVLGLVFAPTFARLTFAQTLAVKSAEYVEAARAFSAGTPTILVKVILPNIAGALVAQFPITLANAILLESGLSYLGLGITPPTPSWGGMVASGQRFMSVDPTLLIVASATIALTVLSFGLIGDGVRDVLDPRERKGVTHVQ
ncbi:ABC transporter permease [Streptomyces chartreusis]|uniref:ABC transporter permease n=1 Tax=Streptomyces chartreusis TaxID=1969 RepID=UPI003665DC3E